MADVWDLRVNVSGDGEEFRADIDEDKAKLDELLAQLRDKAISIKVNDADAEVKLEDIERRLADMHDATADVRVHDVKAKETLDAFRAKLAEVHDIAANIYLEDADAQLQVDELAHKLDALRNSDVNVDLHEGEANAKMDALDAKMQEFRDANAKIDVHMDQAAFEETKVDLDELAARKAEFDRDWIIRPVVDKADLAESEAELATLAVDEEAVTGAGAGKKRTSALGFLSSLLGRGKGTAAADTGAVSLADLLGSLGQDMTVPKNAQGAEAQVGKLGAEIDAMIRGAKEIDVASGEGKLALYDFDQRAQQLASDLASVDISSAGAARQVGKLQDEALALRVDLARIPVHLETTEAQAKLDALKAEAESFGGGASGAGGGAATGAAGGGGGGAGLLGGILASLIPLASPLAAVLAGGAGGLLSALGASMGGLGAFGVAAIPTIKSVTTASTAVNAAQAQLSVANTPAQRTSALQALAKATAGLDKEQLAALHSLQSFEGVYKSFATSLKTPVLNAFNGALRVLSTMLTDIAPAARSMGNEIGKLLGQLNHGLKVPDAGQFFHWMAVQGPKMFADFAHGMANIGRGIANLMMAFTPMANSMGAGWVKMTKDFSNWADALGKSKGFQQFLGYVQKTGPMVLSLIANLGKIVMDLLKDMAPLGGVMLSFVLDLAKLVNNLLTTNPAIKALIALVFGMAKNILIAADAVLKFLNWLSKTHPVIMGVITALAAAAAGVWAFNVAVDANPISLIIIAIAALIAGIVELVVHWRQVIAWLQKVWQSFNHLGLGVKILIGIFAPFLVLPAEIISHWKPIEQFFASMWGNIIKGFKLFMDLFKLNWNQIGDYLSVEVAKWVNEALTWGEHLMQSLANGIMSGLKWVTNAAASVGSAIRSFLGHSAPPPNGALSDDNEWMPHMMQSFVTGIEAGLPAVRAALGQVFVPPSTAQMMRAGTGMASAAAMGAAGNVSAAFHVHVNAPVYGVNDLQGAIHSGAVSVIGEFAKTVLTTGRASGVS